jgi:hypothetical protein
MNIKKCNKKYKKDTKVLIEKSKREKNWKLMGVRSCKLARAKQLGFEYPTRSIRQILDYELPLS